MTISRSTSIVNGVMFVLICCVALLVWNLYRNVEDNIRMNSQKEVALQLANELMQSSEQLTNNVREYAVTGDDRYEKIYLAIVDERAGKIPRSQSKSVDPGRTVSLTDLMRENGFTEQEFALVKQANDLSNELVVLETKAMNAVKGITTGPDGSEVRGKPDLELARSLVFGADYKRQTDKIMQPLAEFFRTLSARTAAQVEESRASVMRGIYLLAATLLLLAGALVYSFIFVRRGICRPLADTAAFARQVIEGDHSSRLHDTTQNEVGELARALDKMLDKLVAELAFSKGVLSSMPTPVMVCDTEEIIRFVNAPMLDLFAHTGDPESYEGTGMRAFIGADDDICRRCVESRKTLREDRHLNIPGKGDVFGAAMATPIFDNQQIVRDSLVVWLDYTEITRQQRHMEETAERIQEAAGETTARIGTANTACGSVLKLIAKADDSSRQTSERMAETMAAMEQMNAAVLNIAKNAEDAASHSATMRDKASEGQDIVNEVVAAISAVQEKSLRLRADMEHLHGEAQNITQVMTVISDIADQSPQCRHRGRPRRGSRTRLRRGGRRGPQAGRKDHGRHHRSGQDHGRHPARCRHQHEERGRSRQQHQPCDGSGPRFRRSSGRHRPPVHRSGGHGAAHRLRQRGTILHLGPDQRRCGRSQQHQQGTGRCHVAGHRIHAGPDR